MFFTCALWPTLPLFFSEWILLSLLYQLKWKYPSWSSFKSQHLHVTFLFSQARKNLSLLQNAIVYFLQLSQVTFCSLAQFLCMYILSTLPSLIKNPFYLYCNFCLKSNFTCIVLLFPWLQIKQTDKQTSERPRLYCQQVIKLGYESKFQNSHLVCLFDFVFTTSFFVCMCT